MPDQVALMATLHDHDEHAGLGIVKPCRQHLVPHPERGLTDYVGLDIFDVVGIIDHDNVGAETGDRRKRHCPAIAAGVIVELSNLGVVEANPVAPPPLIPVRFDEPAAGKTMLI
jgi:hypothetical protein